MTFADGQRVRLTSKAATSWMRFKRTRLPANQVKTTRCGVNWHERIGMIRVPRSGKHLVSGSTNALVVWDGNKRHESVPVQALESLP